MLNFAFMKYINAIIFLLLTIATHAQDWQDVKITANLENNQVSGFIHDVDYSGIVSRNYDSKYYSKITNYTNIEVPYRKDQPAPVKVPLPEAAVANLQLEYYDTEHPDNIYCIEIHEGATEVEIWNLTPGKEYRYSVEGITQGMITTEGQLRQIRVDSGFNVREIGGYPTSNGERIRYGLIYRGSRLYDKRNIFTDEDLEELRRIGIKAELDLRADVVQDESALGSDYEFLHLYMQDCTEILTRYPDDIRQAIEFIYENLKADRPVYIHCTFGADRTGTLCALIEALCGVSIGDIYKDYELTSMCSSFDSSLMRYYYTINQRIIRPLGIYSSDNVTPKVREYLATTCNIPEATLDGLVDILLNGKQTTTAIVNQKFTPTPATYNLQGMKVDGNARGLIIEKGKKRLILK